MLHIVGDAIKKKRYLSGAKLSTHLNPLTVSTLIPPHTLPTAPAPNNCLMASYNTN